MPTMTITFLILVAAGLALSAQAQTNDASLQFAEPTPVDSKFYRLHKPSSGAPKSLN